VWVGVLGRVGEALFRDALLQGPVMSVGWVC
jgi:hypothetical protein